jgi:hypothetical protein
MLHDRLQPPGALRDGASADGRSDGAKQNSADLKTRLHGSTTPLRFDAMDSRYGC